MPGPPKGEQRAGGGLFAHFWVSPVGRMILFSGWPIGHLLTRNITHYTARPPAQPRQGLRQGLCSLPLTTGLTVDLLVSAHMEQRVSTWAGPGQDSSREGLRIPKLPATEACSYNEMGQNSAVILSRRPANHRLGGRRRQGGPCHVPPNLHIAHPLHALRTCVLCSRWGLALRACRPVPITEEYRLQDLTQR